MSTISDYSSLLEIGFGLNAAASYVGVFINPVLTSSKAELDRYRWWVEHPERALPNMVEGTTAEDCEDRLVSWERSYSNLEIKTRQVSQWPIGVNVSAAAGCFLFLLIPDMAINPIGLIALVSLVLAPSTIGGLFVWFGTEELRRRERTQAQRAHSLFR